MQKEPRAAVAEAGYTSKRGCSSSDSSSRTELEQDKKPALSSGAERY